MTRGLRLTLDLNIVTAAAAQDSLVAKADAGYPVCLDGVDRHEVRGCFERAGLAGKWRELELDRRSTTSPGATPFELS